MMKKGDKNLVVGLDVGTTKIAALVGEVDEDGRVNLIGHGTSPTRGGLRRGMVVDIDSTANAIRRAVEAADLMSNCQINAVWVGIAGAHVSSQDSQGVSGIQGSEITRDDVRRVIESARAIAIPNGQQIIHAVAQEYAIDGQDGIREPVGMSGVRLEANVHLVTGAVSAVQNITKCVERCGLGVEGIVLEQLAAAHAVLNDDEKSLGVCLVDIGGGTTDVAIYVKGALRHTHVLPIAGDQITNDIAVGLKTPTQHAETIKIKHGGLVYADERDGETAIEVPSVSDRPPRRMARETLMRIVRPRVEEILQYVCDEIRRVGYEEQINAGIVLTGGAAKLPGLTDMAEEIFNMPVRLGTAQGVGGMTSVVSDPENATGIGLILHGVQSMRSGFEPQREAAAGGETVLQRMKRWFQDHV
ncbi:MAG: cell division protein FtsA [Halothiobacillaceae bacterium]